MKERKKSAKNVYENPRIMCMKIRKNVYENPRNSDRDLRADGRLDLLPIIDCLTKFAAVKEKCVRDGVGIKHSQNLK